MVCKWIWYRLPERLPQHQTRKSIDICLISFLVITVSKSTEYTEQVHHLARSWSAPACNTHPPTHSRHSTVDLTSFPATVSIPKLPSSWSSHDQPGRNGSVWKNLGPFHDLNMIQHISSDWVIQHPFIAPKIQAVSPPGAAHESIVLIHVVSITSQVAPVLSTRFLVTKAKRSQDVQVYGAVIRGMISLESLGIPGMAAIHDLWLCSWYLIGNVCIDMHRLIYLDSVVMCTHTSACRWPL